MHNNYLKKSRNDEHTEEEVLFYTTNDNLKQSQSDDLLTIIKGELDSLSNPFLKI
jgi:hypothetical protein